MAQQVYHRTVEVDKNTPPPGGGFDFDIPIGVCDSIEVRIPDGHAGKTGLVIWYAGTQYVPNAGSSYLVENGGTYIFDLDDVPTGQGWTWAAFNTDVYNHSFYVTFNVNPVPFAADPNDLPIIMLPFRGEDDDGTVGPGDIGYRPF